jgi:hypothetical protein
MKRSMLTRREQNPQKMLMPVSLLPITKMSNC